MNDENAAAPESSAIQASSMAEASLHDADLELPPPSAEEHEALRVSIAATGVLQPIIVSDGPALRGEIADGRVRSAICDELGITCPSVGRQFESAEAFAHFRLVTNIVRRDLPVAERVRLGMAMEPYERRLALERKAQATGAKRGTKSLPVDRPGETGETRELVARKVGLSASTYQRGAKVLREGSPALVARFQAGESVNRAYASLKEELARDERRALTKALRENPLPRPDGRYPVIVLDPPWPIAGVPYPTMSLEEIAALPIAELLAEDAVVWLWTTNCHFEHALAIATERWGLTKRQIITWDKVRPARPTPWLTGQTEHCLLLTMGSPLFEAGALTNHFSEPRRENSRKPEAFYELVRKTCPALPRLEMFAREEREGFVSWGAEVDYFDDSKGAA